GEVVRERSTSLLGGAYTVSCFLLPIFITAPNTRSFYETTPGKALFFVYLVAYVAGGMIGSGRLARGFAATIEHRGWGLRTLAAVAGGIVWCILATLFFVPAILVSLSYGKPFSQWEGGALFMAACVLGGFALFGVRQLLLSWQNSPD